MNNKNYIRSLLALNNMTVIELAAKMTAMSDEKYTAGSLYGKLSRDTLTLKECQLIAKILGYKIVFIKEES